MTYRSKEYNMETAIDLVSADYELVSSYKWEVEKDSWRSNHYPINIVTDLLKAFLGNSLVNMFQCATMEDVSQWTNVIARC
jgi:hypothetical protein